MYVLERNANIAGYQTTSLLATYNNEELLSNSLYYIANDYKKIGYKTTNLGNMYGTLYALNIPNTILFEDDYSKLNPLIKIQNGLPIKDEERNYLLSLKYYNII